MKSSRMGGVVGVKTLSLEEAAKFLCTQITTSAGWATGKLGTSEFNALTFYLHRKRVRPDPYESKTIKDITVNAGLWAAKDKTIHETIDEWAEHTFKCLSQLDSVVTWNPMYPYQEDLLLREFANQAVRIPLRALEPYYSPEHQYTVQMTEGPICVVSPFADTIASQWARRAELFPEGGSAGKVWLPSQELHTVKAYFGPNLTPENLALSWSEELRNAGPLATVQHLADQVQETKARYVFVGIGALSIPLVVELKKRGIIALHTGGGTQIMFGVKGDRWTYHNVISKLFNDSWVKPSPLEKPSAASKVEGACYW